MSARRSRTHLRSVTGTGRYLVVCRRHDGRERPWNRYPTRDEAQRVADHLCRVGCTSRVVTDDELALAAEGRAR